MILCCCCRVSYQLHELNIQSKTGRLGLQCALLLLIIVFIIAVEIPFNSIPFYLNQATWPIHTHIHPHTKNKNTTQ